MNPVALFETNLEQERKAKISVLSSHYSNVPKTFTDFNPDGHLIIANDVSQSVPSYFMLTREKNKFASFGGSPDINKIKQCFSSDFGTVMQSSGDWVNVLLNNLKLRKVDWKALVDEQLINYTLTEKKGCMVTPIIVASKTDKDVEFIDVASPTLNDAERDSEVPDFSSVQDQYLSPAVFIDDYLEKKKVDDSSDWTNVAFELGYICFEMKNRFGITKPICEELEQFYLHTREHQPARNVFPKGYVCPRSILYSDLLTQSLFRLKLEEKETIGMNRYSHRFVDNEETLEGLFHVVIWQIVQKMSAIQNLDGYSEWESLLRFNGTKEQVLDSMLKLKALFPDVSDEFALAAKLLGFVSLKEIDKSLLVYLNKLLGIVITKVGPDLNLLKDWIRKLRAREKASLALRAMKFDCPLNH